MRVWYEEYPNLYREVCSSIERSFPSLHPVLENGTVFIRGALHLPNELGFYSIEIQLLDDYPDSVPLVWETGGKIPRIADRHTNLAGNCCFFVPEETYKYYPKGTTIIDFIEQVVIGYFLNQRHFESSGKWLWGERRHGVAGILAFYEEELNTNNHRVIYSFIESLAKQTIREYQICFCGSKKKLGNCHFKDLKLYRERISQQTASNSLEFWRWELREKKRVETLEKVELAENHMRNAIIGVRP